jgi:hypothetical protein
MPLADGRFHCSIFTGVPEVGWILASLPLPELCHVKGDGCPSVKAGGQEDQSEGHPDFATKRLIKGWALGDGITGL